MMNVKKAVLMRKAFLGVTLKSDYLSLHRKWAIQPKMKQRKQFSLILRSVNDSSVVVTSFFILLLLLILLVTARATSVQAAGQDDFVFRAPAPTGNDFNDVYTPDGLTFYMVGDGGTFFTYNENTGFAQIDTPSEAMNYELRGIHGTSATDIWIVGQNYYAEAIDEKEYVLHYNGSTFTEHEIPDNFGYTYALNDVYVAASNDVWVVSESNGDPYHYDGSTWANVSIPGYSANFGLESVFGFSANDIYFVGDCGQILHKENSTWTVERTTTSCSGDFSTDLLHDVWGFDADHVWALGNYNRILVREADGTWSTMPMSNNFYAMSGPAADQIYFFGDNGYVAGYDGTDYTMILDHQYDYPSNQYGAAQFSDGTSFVVGASGFAAQFNGVTLSNLHEPVKLDWQWDFAGWTRNDIWLSKSFVYNSGVGLYTWDGTDFTSINLGLDTSIQYVPVGLAALAPNDVFLSLRDMSLNVYMRHYDGSNWSDYNIPGIPHNQVMTDAARDGSDNLFMLLTDSLQTSGEPCYINPGVDRVCQSGNFNALAVADDGYVYAVGQNGTIVRYNVGTGIWTSETSNAPADLTFYDVAAGGGSVCAVGSSRTMYCKQGTGAWTKVTGITAREENIFTKIAHKEGGEFFAILSTGNGASSNYIGADKTEIYRIYNGITKKVFGGMSNTLRDIAVSPAGDLLFVGEEGTLFGDLFSTIYSWYVNQSTGKISNDCLSATTPCLTIGAAMDKASAGDTIIIDSGTYSERLTISKNLTFSGAGSGVTYIDGDAGGRVLYVSSDTVVSMQQLTVQNGDTSANGSGIYNEGTLTLDEVNVTNNTTTSGSGGGIYNSVNGILTTKDTTLSLNQSPASYGAALFNNGGQVTMEKSTIFGNSTNPSNYDIIHNENGGTINMTNVTVSENISGRILVNTNISTVNILNSTISDNSGQIENDATINCKNTLISGNNTGGSGDNCASPLISQGYNLDSSNSCGFSAASDLTSMDPLLSPLANNGGVTKTQSLNWESPAVDSGDNNGCPPTDQRGETRPFDGDNNGSATCDIGAFELSKVDLGSPWPMFLPAIIYNAQK